MDYVVLLSRDAEDDIAGIYRYVATHDSAAAADSLLNRLEKTCYSLARLPERGNIPRELQEIGVTEYREIHFKPYRILYRILNQQVIVYCVLDGRRDMQSLLHSRLIRP